MIPRIDSQWAGRLLDRYIAPVAADVVERLELDDEATELVRYALTHAFLVGVRETHADYVDAAIKFCEQHGVTVPMPSIQIDPRWDP